MQVIFQTNLYISNPWNLECKFTLVTAVACTLTHSASLFLLEPAPVESSASALLPSRPSSENLPPHPRALMRAPGWYSGKAGRSLFRALSFLGARPSSLFCSLPGRSAASTGTPRSWLPVFTLSGVSPFPDSSLLRFFLKTCQTHSELYRSFLLSSKWYLCVSSSFSRNFLSISFCSLSLSF